MTRMKTLSFLVAVGVVGLACAACGNANDNVTDAGTDAANDAVSNVDGGGDAGALVAECQTLAHHFATLCAGSDPRPCEWNAYADLCRTGQTQLLVESMKCLAQNTCRTFSDPNAAATCLDTLHKSSQSAAAKKWISDTCTACNGTNCSQVNGTDEILPYLGDADIAALSSCQGSACSVDGIVQACASSISDLQPFLACTAQ